MPPSANPPATIVVLAACESVVCMQDCATHSESRSRSASSKHCARSEKTLITLRQSWFEVGTTASHGRMMTAASTPDLQYNVLLHSYVVRHFADCSRQDIVARFRQHISGRHDSSVDQIRFKSDQIHDRLGHQRRHYTRNVSALCGVGRSGTHADDFPICPNLVRLLAVWTNPRI